MRKSGEFICWIMRISRSRRSNVLEAIVLEVAGDAQGFEAWAALSNPWRATCAK